MKVIYIQPCDEAVYLTEDDKTKIEQRFGSQQQIEAITLSFDGIESFTLSLTDSQHSADVYVLPYSQKEIALTLVAFNQSEQTVIVVKCNDQAEVEVCQNTISSSQVSIFDGIAFHRSSLHHSVPVCARQFPCGGGLNALQESPNFDSGEDGHRPTEHGGNEFVAFRSNSFNFLCGVSHVGFMHRLDPSVELDGAASSDISSSSVVYTPSHSSLSSVASDDERFVDSHSSNSLSSVASDDECSVNTRSSYQANQS